MSDAPRTSDPSGDRFDDDLDAETVADDIAEFLEPTAESPAADADAPPPG